MKPKLIVLLVIIVVAPLGFLSYLSIKVNRDEREMLRVRFNELLLNKLGDVAGVVEKVVEEQKRELGRITDIDNLDPETLREIVHRERIVRQLFATNSQGKLIHPPTETASEAEKSFLVRTKRIFRGATPFTKKAQDTSRTSKRSSLNESRDEDSGFYVWYWDEGLSILFWRRDQAGRFIGAELSRVVLLADIIAELPQAGNEKSAVEGSWIELVDANGKPVYGWGKYKEKDKNPRVELALRPPLGSWKLKYFASPEAMDKPLGKSILFNVLFSVGALGLALLGLAFYFYRENTREINEAMRRVNFVNQVSHELRTPLTNIRMYAELLEERVDHEDEKGSGYANVIVAESQRLSRLISNVLTFSRQQRSDLTVRPKPARVDDVVDKVLRQLSLSFEKKGIVTEFSRGADLDAQVDSDALEQILGNLLSNVEKYAAGGKRVDITTAVEGQNTVITVADKGGGISRSLKEKVFEPFYRPSNSLTEGVSGAGIGLGISRELARAHGGDLTLEKSDLGALFKIVLLTPQIGERQ